jgi:lipopolysaccharide export system permease protein
MLAFKYISYHYLKYFMIIMVALSMFMVGFDFLQNINDLPKSANILLLYITYRVFFSIDMLLPLALVFAMISTKIYLIRSNALVSFYSLGYSRVDILKPFVLISTLIITLFIAAHATTFARADEFANNIKKTQQYLNPTKDMFFTYGDKYIYFGELFPLQKKADNVRVFQLNNGNLKEIISSTEATFRDGEWHLKNVHILEKPSQINSKESHIIVTDKDDVAVLKDFKPKILDQVYEGKVNFMIGDAIDALLLFKDQNLNVSQIKSALYKIFIYPFFVPALIVIIFFFVPTSGRFINVSLFSFGAILATLVIWGLIFMMIEYANNKTVSSEVGIMLPVVILGIVSFIQYKRYSIR